MARLAGRQMVEPHTRLGGDGADEIAQRPVARGPAGKKYGVDRMVGQVHVRDALVAVHHLIGVVVVEQHDAVGAEQLDPRGVSKRRVLLRQRITDAEIDRGSVVVAQDRPGEIVGCVTGCGEHAAVADRDHFDEVPALEIPVHEVDVVGERIDHRRRVRIAGEHGERLRT